MGLLPYMAVFVKVVELGSFSAAAEKLGSTASSVSRQIASLENALGVKLLERTTRRLRLTEAGTVAWERCFEMMQSAESVFELAGRISDTPQGRVRISAPRAYGKDLISPHVAEFLQRYPQVDLQLMLTDRMVDLISDDVDLAIRITDTPPPGLVARPLFPVRHVLCASAEYLQQHGIPEHPQDLTQHNCIYLGEVPGDNQWKFRHITNGEQISVAVHGRYASNHSKARLEGIIHHLGIGCLPRFSAQQVMDNRQIIQVLPEWDYMTSYYGMSWILYHPNRYLPPKCRVLIDFLLEKLKHQTAHLQSH